MLSFQDAAASLHVTPSAVSHQIRNLESLLGYPLFERLDKSIRLTKRGSQLYSEIRDPLKQIHHASHNALRGSQDNSLALSVPPVLATRWLLPRLKNFHAQHPEINLAVIATPDLVDFRSDRFDAAIRMGNGRWPDTVSKRLFAKRIVAVCHPELLTRNGGTFTVEELLSQPLIHNVSMSGLWQEWFNSAGVALTGALSGIEVPSSAQVLEAIDVGEAIGLLDLSFIRNDLEIGRLARNSDHLLFADDGYFLTYPEVISGRAALQQFEQWVFSEVEID